MLLRRLDDYQSWQVVVGGGAVLIDPWLTPEAITGSFDRRHTHGFATAQDARTAIDGSHVDSVGVLLCTGVNDHARPESLKLMHGVPVIGPRGAARVARRAGCRDVEVLRVGSTRRFATPGGGAIHVTATRCGLPLGLIAVGYLIEGRSATGAVLGRMWIEPHQPTDAVARSVAPVDVALLPHESVTAVVLPVTAGPRTAARAATASGARIVIPTATDPARDMSAWQRALYRVRDAGAAEIAVLSRPMRAGEWLSVR
jgi:L-ascorbate metabolism protein UlaG (beta-lactamase superfamily)